MRHVGDITKLNGAELPVVDVITGGSPCQDLSIAGARAGLAGERSGLFMEQIRVVKEMRDEDRRTGRTGWNVRPRYMVWENVPGAFSSNRGKDFGAVLTEIVRIVCKEAPDVPVPDKGWPKSGCIFGVGDDGTGFSVCYRLHDAQFWGVPQRRKRIALVADFGGLSAPEILFERKGLRWDTPQSGEKRQGTSAGTEESIGNASYTLKIRGGREIDSYGKRAGKGALIQKERAGTIGVSQDQTLVTSVCAGFCPEESAKTRGIGYQEEGSPSLRAGAVPAAVMSLNSKQLGLDTAIELASTLGASDYKEPQSVLAVDMGGGKGSCNIQRDKSPTLATTHGGEPAICAVDVYNQTTTGEISKTLNSIASDADHVPCVMGFNRERCGAVVGEDVMPTLQAAAGESGNNKPMVYVKTARGKFPGDAETIVESETAPTLNTFDTGDKRTSVFCLQGNGIDRADTAGCNGRGWTEDVSYTLNTIDRPAVVSVDGYNGSTAETASTLGVNCGMSTGRNGVMVLNDQGGSVMGVSEEVTGALRSEEHGHQPAVLVENHPQDSRVQIREDGIVQTLDARMGMGGGNTPMVMEASCIGNGQVAQTRLSEKVGALNCMHDQQAVMTYGVVTKGNGDAFLEEEYHTSLSTGGGQAGQGFPCTMTNVVRRLTPMECERLQGFPDGWTDIGAWVDSKGKLHKESTDSARYKALGNSIALPFWFWLLRRISAQYERPATLGSLFDGIGGFPLCWERCNGSGTAVWASEIEEFPIAVTKYRFGGE